MKTKEQIETRLEELNATHLYYCVQIDELDALMTDADIAYESIEYEMKLELESKVNIIKCEIEQLKWILK